MLIWRPRVAHRGSAYQPQDRPRHPVILWVQLVVGLITLPYSLVAFGRQRDAHLADGRKRILTSVTSTSEVVAGLPWPYLSTSCWE